MEALRWWREKERQVHFTCVHIRLGLRGRRSFIGCIRLASGSVSIGAGGILAFGSSLQWEYQGLEKGQKQSDEQRE